MRIAKQAEWFRLCLVGIVFSFIMSSSVISACWQSTKVVIKRIRQQIDNNTHLGCGGKALERIGDRYNRGWIPEEKAVVKKITPNPIDLEEQLEGLPINKLRLFIHDLLDHCGLVLLDTSIPEEVSAHVISRLGLWCKKNPDSRVPPTLSQLSFASSGAPTDKKYYKGYQGLQQYNQGEHQRHRREVPELPPAYKWQDFINQVWYRFSGLIRAGYEPFKPREILDQISQDMFGQNYKEQGSNQQLDQHKWEEYQRRCKEALIEQIKALCTIPIPKSWGAIK